MNVELDESDAIKQLIIATTPSNCDISHPGELYKPLINKSYLSYQLVNIVSSEIMGIGTNRYRNRYYLIINVFSPYTLIDSGSDPENEAKTIIGYFRESIRPFKFLMNLISTTGYTSNGLDIKKVMVEGFKIEDPNGLNYYCSMFRAELNHIYRLS